MMSVRTRRQSADNLQRTSNCERLSSPHSVFYTRDGFSVFVCLSGVTYRMNHLARVTLFTQGSFLSSICYLKQLPCSTKDLITNACQLPTDSDCTFGFCFTLTVLLEESIDSGKCWQYSDRYYPLFLPASLSEMWPTSPKVSKRHHRLRSPPMNHR